MTETTEQKSMADGNTIDRLVGWAKKPSTWILVVIVVLAIATRIPNLGDRVMSHDEINHVYFAWLFTENGTYQHDPLSHGPLQFHLLAFAYRVIGDSDFASRLPAALAGIGAVALLWAYRRWLGVKGALAAAAMMVFSPYMMFYSRYTRNEIFVVFEALLVVWAVFRYLEDRRPGWLYLLAASLALHATTKETFFLYTAQLLFFLFVVMSIQLLQSTWSRPSQKRWFGLGLGVAVLGFGLAMAVFLRDRTAAGEAAAPVASPLVFIGVAFGLLGAALAVIGLIRGIGKKLRTDYPVLDIFLVTATLTLPQLAALPAQAMGWDPMLYQETDSIVRTGALVVLLMLIAAGFGLAWNARRWLACVAIFLIIFIPLYTSMFTHPFGLFSGLVGSLGYWLVQQGVERGSQPWYYYAFLQIPMYEFLPAIGALIGTGFAIRKLWSRETDTLPGEGGTPQAASAQRLFVTFMVYWVITALIIYTYAGERMPWLTVHIALPLILLAAWAFDAILQNARWEEILQWKSLLMVATGALAVTALAQSVGYVFGFTPTLGSSFAEIERTLGWVMAIIIAGALIYLILRLARGYSGLSLLRIFGLALISLLFLQTVRTSVRASFVKHDTAEEFLVYAHAARGPVLALEEVERLSNHMTGSTDLQIAYDNHAAYPYWWYMRRYANAKDVGATPNRDLLEYPVVFAGEENYSKFEAFLGDNYRSQTYERLWWPLQDYFNLTSERIRNALSSPEMLRALWDIWFDRDYRAYAALVDRDLSPRGWQPASRMKMYVRNDLAAAIPGMAKEPTFAEEITFEDPYLMEMEIRSPDLVLGSQGEGPGSFNSPRGLTVGPDGLYIADSGNHRIQVISTDGTVINSFGSFADTQAGAAPGGTFNQPWDVQLGPDGTIHVADTWNHRVQSFDPDGTFLSTAGSFGTSEETGALWGPRALAIDDDRRTYVTDTGNKRIIVLDPDGESIAQIGMGGVGVGQFDEPVGLALGPDGRLYVADTWNQRVQVFDETFPGEFEPIAEWPVQAWFGQSLENKPFLAVSREGHVCVTDPEGARVLCFDDTGRFLSGWTSPSMTLSSGLAFDDQCRVWVTDSGVHQVMRFDPGFCLPEEIP